MGLRFYVDDNGKAGVAVFDKDGRIVVDEPKDPDDQTPAQIYAMLERAMSWVPKSDRESAELAGAHWYPGISRPDREWSVEDRLRIVAGELHRLGYRIVKQEPGSGRDYLAADAMRAFGETAAGIPRE